MFVPIMSWGHKWHPFGGMAHIWLKCLYWNILHSTYDKTFMDFYINFSPWNDLPNSIQAAESLYFQETAENTSLPSSFDPLTLALSILMWIIILSVFFIKKTWPSNICTLYSISILTTFKLVYKEFIYIYL